MVQTRHTVATGMRSILCAVAVLMTTPVVAASEIAGSTPAPAFNLPGIDQSISLEDYRGNVVYIDFWASWCTPCRKSFPWMNHLHEQYADKGLTVVAINLDENPADATGFLKDTQPDFVIAFDAQGQSARDYRVMGMPSSYIIDRNGNLLGRHIGFRNKDTSKLEKQILAALEDAQ